MASLQSPTGPVYTIAAPVLHRHTEYAAFRNGTITRAEFARFLDNIAPSLWEAGLLADDVQFAKRYPSCEAAFVRDAMRRLAAHGIVPQADYDEASFELTAVRAQLDYDHGPFRTYIYPEEARLLFAVCEVLRPRRTVVLGSYYGYWAYWAAAAVAPYGGSIVLVDPDPAAQAIATANFGRLGVSGTVQVIVDTGQAYLARCHDSIDCIVLDAELPRTHGDPSQRGKAIYGALLEAALARVQPRAVLVCHNVLFEDIAGAAFFGGVIDRNRYELATFLSLVSSHCHSFVECASTEGVGVGRFGRVP